MNIRAVIFDWDGVVARSDPFNEYALGEVFRKRGLHFGHEQYRRHFLAKTLKDGLLEYLRENVQPIELLSDLIIEKKSFDGEYGEWVAPYEDALAFIERLRGKYPLAIASGTRRVLLDAGLKKFGIADVFCAVATSEDYENGKPAPDAFLAALRKLRGAGYDLEPANTLVIEDAPGGVKAAKVAGMKCVAVTHTHTPQELREADLTSEDLRDLRIESL